MQSELRRLTLRTGITVPCLVRAPTGSGASDVNPAPPPLLLLHPWGESHKSFDRLLPLLPPSLAILAPDQRGQGAADKPEDGYSLAQMADDVAALLEALGVTNACVLGSSSGGYLAQQLAVDRPDLVSALILVGSPLSLRSRPAFAAEVAQLRDPVDEQWVRDSLTWFQVLHIVPRWYMEDRVQDGVVMPARAWRGILDGLCEAVPPTEQGSISVPTLILWGAHDSLIPRSHQETLAARIPGAQLVIYGATGHIVLWECPERIAADVAKFLGAASESPTQP
ncbi:alpha/beta fold hydrolase [Arthrobacter cupressi]|uniref:Rifampin ADP-ribosylating transferase n=1 Tax=Arthrobacter cupressi TaxID=1045773 RepID=A0A1G8KPB0_9MICC|nr:alpha/beta fold hydrolase [Arthrobacter cupressi]NYD77161.1 rifampin ADP-ribosylating transferase [Arthrobacter cupressi]SDI44730.1 rifampin ADP-ribosylating transferase [Arthrobacter cupressi]